MKVKFVAAAAASVVAGLIGTSAQAATVAWGNHDPLESAVSFFFGTGSTLSISDTYTFSLASGSTFDIATAYLGGGFFSSNPLLTLKDGANATLFTMSLNDPTKYTLNLAAGNYSYTVVGTAVGSFGYSLSSSIVQVTPVPEPETYAMMLAGLAALGFLARRRQG